MDQILILLGAILIIYILFKISKKIIKYSLFAAFGLAIFFVLSGCTKGNLSLGSNMENVEENALLRINDIPFVKESKIIEAANVPSNIADFAKRRGVLKDVKQIARWAEKAGKRITGGTAIGKNYDTLILDLTYQGGEIRYDTVRGTFTLNGEPVDSWKTFSKAVNESSERDGTEASDGKHKHNDHLEEDMEEMWKKAYGEKFATKYPGVAKIIRQRKITDKREIARIWQETYGENFKEEYPAMWDMMSK